MPKVSKISLPLTVLQCHTCT